MVAHRRGPWSQHEDRYLIELVTRNGPHNWVRISQEITTRSPKQCRERYHQNLKPSLNHEPISPEEGELIEKLVAEMGKRWAEIARRLKGRSDNAVKNWWNGGQNRRKRNPERDQPPQSQMHHPQPAYHYPAVAHSTHHEEEASHSSYSSSRRPSLNPSVPSPHALKLPQPQGFEPYRPTPLNFTHSTRAPAFGAPGYDTPMPSPSGYSIVSADGAPSLITDTGSESRSPRGAASPLELTLAPLVGGRDERRNSSHHYLPSTGFVNDDDQGAYKQVRQGPAHLPRLVNAEKQATMPLRESPFRQEYRTERPQLLTQPAHALVHHHSLPYSAPLPEQRSLPSFATIADPGRVPLPSPRNSSPSSRQLPSPFSRPAQASGAWSVPVSPKDKLQDSRMSLQNIM